MLVGIITLVIGVLAFAGVAKAFFQSTTTVTGNVTAFILNPEGKIDGAVLDTGDQIHFSAETGALVAGQTKVGEPLTVTGHAGSKSLSGREIEAVTLQSGENIITVLHALRPVPPRKGDQGRPLPSKERKGERPAPSLDDAQPNPRAKTEDGAPSSKNGLMDEQNPAPLAPLEMVTVNGTVKIVLVSRRGEARGLILSGGEQIALPKEVADAGLTFSQETAVGVEGEAARSAFGSFIRPVRLTIGAQTFSFNR